MKRSPTVKPKLSQTTALIGFAGSPWTVACYMIEGKNSHQNWIKVKHYALNNPSRFQNFLDYLVESTTVYLIGQIDAGVEVIQLFDTWANSVPASYFPQWVIEPTRKIVSLASNKKDLISQSSGLFQDAARGIAPIPLKLS